MEEERWRKKDEERKCKKESGRKKVEGRKLKEGKEEGRMEDRKDGSKLKEIS